MSDFSYNAEEVCTPPPGNFSPRDVHRGATGSCHVVLFDRGCPLFPLWIPPLASCQVVGGNFSGGPVRPKLSPPEVISGPCPPEFGRWHLAGGGYAFAICIFYHFLKNAFVCQMIEKYPLRKQKQTSWLICTLVDRLFLKIFKITRMHKIHVGFRCNQNVVKYRVLISPKSNVNLCTPVILNLFKNNLPACLHIYQLVCFCFRIRHFLLTCQTPASTANLEPMVLQREKIKSGDWLSLCLTTIG